MQRRYDDEYGKLRSRALARNTRTNAPPPTSIWLLGFAFLSPNIIPKKQSANVLEKGFSASDRTDRLLSSGHFGPRFTPQPRAT